MMTSSRRMKTLNKKNIGIGFLIYFIAITIYSGIYNSDYISKILGGGLMGLVYYIVANPAYLLVFMTIIISETEKVWKEILSAVLIIWAIDIISFPRMPIDAFPTDPNFLANSDFIFMTKLTTIFSSVSYATLWKIYYIVLPIALVIGASQLLGFTHFGKKLANQNK